MICEVPRPKLDELRSSQGQHLLRMVRRGAASNPHHDDVRESSVEKGKKIQQKLQRNGQE